jgi:YHS domain-containing protein
MATMTSARRRQILAVLAVLPVLATASAIAAVTERVVTDFHTGLALNGFDPVAYFTDAAPIPGRAELEYRFRGVIWRFANEGNLAAFARNADQYVPRFGGYDPIAVARGVALAGNPAFWLIVRDRLYLFYSAEALTRFKADAEGAVAAAEAKWPTVQDSLIP